MYLLTEWFGAFLLDDAGVVKAEALFPKDARQLALILRKFEENVVLDEERALAAKGTDLKVREPRHQTLPGTHLVEKTPTFADRAKDYGFTRQHLHDAAMELGKLGVRHASSRRDMHVVQAVDAIDEMHEQANVLVERLREWYGLHFPELVDRNARNEDVAALVSAHGNRDAIGAANPTWLVEDSMGGPLPAPEQEAVRALARIASHLYSTRAELEKYLDVAMLEIAPNTAALLQPVLAARMIKQAGGLRRLSTMPAGTIQTLGAEKALFRHIKEGKRPPKHGYLMQHPLIHRAPRNQRGALARSLAAKVALAARADSFTHAPGIGAKLAEDFAKRAEMIREQQTRRRKSGGPRREGRGPPRTGPGRGPPPGRGGGGGFRGPPPGGRGQGGWR